MAKFFGSILGILFFVAIGVFFFDTAMKTPVAELSPDGECLRVLSEGGQKIPKGCELFKAGKLATEHRYVAR